jgi:hypothetical protein
MKPQTDWAFAVWNSLPAIWSEVAAFTLAEGEWKPANFDQVGMEGRSSTKKVLEVDFGRLAELPIFPSDEVNAAYRTEEKRLRSRAILNQPQAMRVLTDSGPHNQEKFPVARSKDLYDLASVRFPVSALRSSSLRSSKTYPR